MPWSAWSSKEGGRLKLIEDIRLFESDVDNIDGNPNPTDFGQLYQYNYRDWADISTRYLFKLREIGFSMPDFTHIYLNLTPLLRDGETRLAARARDPYHPFFHYVDVGLTVDRFNALSQRDKSRLLLDAAVRVLQRHFCPSEAQRIAVEHCAAFIREQGAEAPIIYKHKENGDDCVDIVMKVINYNAFRPSVRIRRGSQPPVVYVFDKTLDRCGLLARFGSITIHKQSVVIHARRTSSDKPLRYDA